MDGTHPPGRDRPGGYSRRVGVSRRRGGVPVWPSVHGDRRFGGWQPRPRRRRRPRDADGPPGEHRRLAQAPFPRHGIRLGQQRVDGGHPASGVAPHPARPNIAATTAAVGLPHAPAPPAATPPRQRSRRHGAISPLLRRRHGIVERARHLCPMAKGALSGGPREGGGGVANAAAAAAPPCPPTTAATRATAADATAGGGRTSTKRNIPGGGARRAGHVQHPPAGGLDGQRGGGHGGGR